MTNKSSLARAAAKFLAGKSAREIRRLTRKAAATGRVRRPRRFTATHHWQQWEVELLGRVTDVEAAKLVGRSLNAAKIKRVRLRRLLRPPSPRRSWSKAEEKWLGAPPDEEGSGSREPPPASSCGAAGSGIPS